MRWGTLDLGAKADLAAEGARRVFSAFRGENLRLRAMSLTFLSLFATVPALVVAFTVLTAFAPMHGLWERLREFLIANLTVGARSIIEPQLELFVRNVHAASAGAVSGLFLVWSLWMLFGYVESTLNDIWFVRRGRSLRQRLLIYWMGLTLGPFLLAGSLALTAAPRLQGKLLAEWGSAALTVAAFAVLYVIVPATKVRIGPAIAGAAVAGLTWEVAKEAYRWAVKGVFQYHAVYGSVAAIPIFLLWLNLSWLVFLSGARIAFVAQHHRTLLTGREEARTPLEKELLAARVMVAVALAFHRGDLPPDPEALAERLGLLGEPVREALASLRAGDLVVDVSGGGVVPARPLSRLTLSDVRRVVAGPVPEAPQASSGAVVAAILAGAEGAASDAMGRTSLEELCERLASQGQGGAGEPGDAPA